MSDRARPRRSGGLHAVGGAARRNEGEDRFLRCVSGLLRDLERDLDAARVLLPECHRFRKVISCVRESLGPGMGASPGQVKVPRGLSLLLPSRGEPARTPR